MFGILLLSLYVYGKGVVSWEVFWLFFLVVVVLLFQVNIHKQIKCNV